MTRLNEYVKTAEAARIVGVSQNTLRQWAATGKVPVRRNPANGYRLFRRQDLDAFLTQIESGDFAVAPTNKGTRRPHVRSASPKRLEGRRK
jgi:excisionase family DNA binding protein